MKLRDIQLLASMTPLRAETTPPVCNGQNTCGNIECQVKYNYLPGTDCKNYFTFMVKSTSLNPSNAQTCASYCKGPTDGDFLSQLGSWAWSNYSGGSGSCECHKIGCETTPLSSYNFQYHPNGSNTCQAPTSIYGYSYLDLICAARSTTTDPECIDGPLPLSSTSASLCTQCQSESLMGQSCNLASVCTTQPTDIQAKPAQTISETITQLGTETVNIGSMDSWFDFGLIPFQCAQCSSPNYYEYQFDADYSSDGIAILPLSATIQIVKDSCKTPIQKVLKVQLMISGTSTMIIESKLIQIEITTATPCSLSDIGNPPNFTFNIVRYASLDDPNNNVNFVFQAFSQVDCTCSMTYQATKNPDLSTYSQVTDQVAEFDPSPYVGTEMYFYVLDPTKVKLITFYILATDNASPEPNRYIYSQQLTLDVQCSTLTGISISDFNTLVNFQTIGDLTALGPEDSTKLEFSLIGLQNQVTDCPINSVVLVSSCSGSALTNVGDLGDQGLGVYKFNIVYSKIAQTITFAIVITIQGIVGTICVTNNGILFSQAVVLPPPCTYSSIGSFTGSTTQIQYASMSGGSPQAFFFVSFSNVDTTCTMTYAPSATPSLPFSTKSGLSSTSAPAFTNQNYIQPTNPLLTQSLEFYLQITDDHPGTPNIFIDPTKLTLKIECNSDSWNLDYNSITISPSSPLEVKDISDTTDLTFELSGLVNGVTGCPILSLRLLDGPNVSGNELTRILFVSKDSLGTFLFKMADSHSGDTFQFYTEITFGQSTSHSTFVKYSNVQINKSVVCKPSSTVISAPAIIPNSGSYSFYKMINPALVYEIEQFSSSNPGCPITTLDIAVASSGQTKDQYTADGLQQIKLISTMSDSKIQIQIPNSSIFEEIFKFRLSAQEGQNSAQFTDDITIKKINCDFGFSFESQIVEPDPKTLIIQDPVSPGTVVIAMSGISPLDPDCKIYSIDLYDETKTHQLTQISSLGTLNENKEYEFIFVDPTSKVTFSFYPKLNVNGGQMFGTKRVDVVFTCGDLSTTITAPEILPNTKNLFTHEMVFPENQYTLEKFESSNEDCPVQSVEIATIVNGNQLDYTSKDYSKQIVKMLLNIAGAQNTAILPSIRSVYFEFKFRIKAEADGGSIGYTNNISVTLINCDFAGPTLKTDITPFQILQEKDYRTPFKTFDVSSFFRLSNPNCQINDFKITKVKNALTGLAKLNVDYINIDQNGILRIANFENEIEPSNIYIEAASGERPTWGEDSSFAGSIHIFPPKINQPPVFSPFIEPANIEITGAENENFEVKFPATNDPEGTKVTLDIISTLPSFIKFQKGDNKISLISPIKEGTYVIDIKLTDQDQESTSWKQKIVVIKKQIEKTVENSLESPTNASANLTKSTSAEQINQSITPEQQSPNQAQSSQVVKEEILESEIEVEEASMIESSQVKTKQQVLVILNKLSDCTSRFEKELCDKYFYPGISMQKILNELIVVQVEEKLKIRNDFIVVANNTQKLEPLQLSVLDIDNQGQVLLKFSEEIRPLSEFNLSLALVNQMKVLNITYISGLGEDSFQKSQLLSWNISEFQDTHLLLKLVFDNQIYINLAEIKDLLVIRVEKTYLFETKTSKILIAGSYEVVTEVPSQARSNTEAKQVQFLANSASSSMLLTLIIPLGFQVFMSIGMNRVWSLYLMLQIACNIENVESLKIPGNIEMIIVGMQSTANFKIFENPTVRGYLQQIFGKDSKVQEVLFEQGILVTSSFVLFALLVLILILKKLNKGQKLVQQLRKMIFWSAFFRGQIQTYYQSCRIIFVLGVLKPLNFFKLIIVLFLPIISYQILRKNFYLLEDKQIIQKYETIYQNLYPLKKSVCISTSLFCIKRILIAFVTFSFVRPIVLSISIYTYLSLFAIGYNINMHPMNTKIIQIIDNANELFIMISGYAIIMFSNWIYNVGYDRKKDQDIFDLPELRYLMGFLYLILLTATVGINFFLIIFEIGKGLKKKNKKIIYYKKWEKHFQMKILAKQFALQQMLNSEYQQNDKEKYLHGLQLEIQNKSKEKLSDENKTQNLRRERAQSSEANFDWSSSQKNTKDQKINVNPKSQSGIIDTKIKKNTIEQTQLKSAFVVTPLGFPKLASITDNNLSNDLMKIKSLLLIYNPNLMVQENQGNTSEVPNNGRLVREIKQMIKIKYKSPPKCEVKSKKTIKIKPKIAQHRQIKIGQKDLKCNE